MDRKQQDFSEENEKTEEKEIDYQRLKTKPGV